jgi:hypothetical protein
LDEAGRGDPILAAERLDLLSGIPTLVIYAEFSSLEDDLINLFQLPEKAATDASPLGLPIFRKMDYPLIWNCPHLANAFLQK